MRSDTSLDLHPVLYQRIYDDGDTCISYDWVTSDGLAELRRAVESNTSAVFMAYDDYDGTPQNEVNALVSAYSTFPACLVAGRYGIQPAWGKDETLPEGDVWALTRANYFFHTGVDGDDPKPHRVYLRSGKVFDVVVAGEAFEDGEPEIEARLAASGRWITIRNGAIASYYALGE